MTGSELHPNTAIFHNSTGRYNITGRHRNASRSGNKIGSLNATVALKTLAKQVYNNVTSAWWGCGTSHNSTSLHPHSMRDAISSQMGMGAQQAPAKCELADQRSIHRTYFQLFAGKYYLEFMERMSKQFARFPDELIHVLFIGVTTTESIMIGDLLKCRDINIHTMSAEAKTSSSVAAMSELYKTCKNVHLEDAKTLLPTGTGTTSGTAPTTNVSISLPAWTDEHEVKMFQLVNINLNPADTLVIIEGNVISYHIRVFTNITASNTLLLYLLTMHLIIHLLTHSR